MAVETNMISYNEKAVRTFSEQRGEPAWFQELRLEALANLNVLPMPKPDKTSLTRWNFTDFNFDLHNEASSAELPEELKSLVESKTSGKNVLVLKDQQQVHASLSPELKDKGVIFTDLQTALKEHGELVKPHYMTEAVKADEHRLTAMHTAFVNGGAFLYVPKNVVIEEPLQAVFYNEQEGAALMNHVLIVAEENASVTYIESNMSSGEKPSVANIVTEVIAKQNSQITFGAVDQLANSMTSYVNRRGVAHRDAKIQWALGQMNEGNTVSENLTLLMGDSSYADTKSVSVGKGEQIQNFSTNITHFGKHSEGYILQHGVMKDSASSIFNGIGKIEHGASKSNAEQTSRVLMLNERARGDANPILLIDEDDVTAGHAASVGRVDPIQLFYLMSRGISKAEAERLIIRGFLAPVLSVLPIETVKEQLAEVIERKLS
ncbi:Fe-S cluster assembly protein SufD [Bacillaceae bacterium SIJ1]|uniref:Fe-S cluster assembly protein SufD n=1 Tax=Litoribacterium kuwaitense TaxID=1398745 RepID=UPI0013EA7412|nr:Fe-S cluster assembly protein SufD [Litoribacterium kuwaitense]NGP46330.1 Fe-S cluster assembly protein SufD [Litoribacterium kuwaitense]